jgi:glyoxylase-like metal-dependent hydrolase (beta-lactamase superfamily II)/rhodanese-related sulfurtransferase
MTNNGNSDDLLIKPNELKKKIDKEEDIFILDVRDHEEHKSWKISYDKHHDSLVIPIDDLSSPQSLEQIPKDKEIVAFCARGNRSMSAAKMLSKHGYKVKSVEGGLAGWNTVYDVALVTDKNSSIDIWQIRRVSKGCISYLVASSHNKNAIVIDATCEVDNAISNIISENSLKLTKVVDTHIHADHLSGSTRLTKRYGSVIYLSSLEGYNTKNNNIHGLNFQLISNDDAIKIDEEFILEAIHTPGHTNGSISLKLKKRTDNFVEEGNNPIKKNQNNNLYIFVGDTIFVNGIGRPDLHNKTEEFAHQLFNTYHQKILNLPKETIVLPAHYSEAFEHEKPVYETIKSIHQNIDLLSVPEVEFVKFVTDNIPPRPTNYEKIISINKQMISCDEIEQNDIESGPNSCGIMKK